MNDAAAAPARVTAGLSLLAAVQPIGVASNAVVAQHAAASQELCDDSDSRGCGCCRVR